METFKIKTKVKKNHKVHIDDVPFDDGQEVEIIISASNENKHYDKLRDLKGSVIKYENPFESAITSFENAINDSVNDIVSDFQKTNLYTNEFLKDLEDGLKNHHFLRTRNEN